MDKNIIALLSNSENREHLKNFMNVDCVLASHNKVQDTQAKLKTTNLLGGPEALRTAHRIGLENNR